MRSGNETNFVSCQLVNGRDGGHVPTQCHVPGIIHGEATLRLRLARPSSVLVLWRCNSTIDNVSLCFALFFFFFFLFFTCSVLTETSNLMRKWRNTDMQSSVPEGSDTGEISYAFR